MFQFPKHILKQFYNANVIVFKSILPDLKCFYAYQVLIICLFGVTSVIFNVIDFNSIIDGNAHRSNVIKFINDKHDGIAEWRRVFMCLSALTSFTGVMSVVLTSFGKISCFFWGIINCIFYGLYSIAYGYAGDAQLNIMFLLPMQYIGIIQWIEQREISNEKFVDINNNEPLLNSRNDGQQYLLEHYGDNSKYSNINSIIRSDNTIYHSMTSPTVKVRSLTILQRIASIALATSITIAFYYEIPAFAKAITGTYVFANKPIPRILDAVSNGLSIVAQFLLLFRYWESWLFWIGVNGIQIAMFAGKFSVAGYGIDFNMLIMLFLFTLNSAYGLSTWCNLSRHSNQSLESCNAGIHTDSERIHAGNSNEGSGGGSKAYEVYTPLPSNDANPINYTVSSPLMDYNEYCVNDLQSSEYTSKDTQHAQYETQDSDKDRIKHINNRRTTNALSPNPNYYTAVGVVIGKFYPFHKGHELLVHTALQHCHTVHCIICYKIDEQPSVKLRYAWIRELFPYRNIVIYTLYDIYDPWNSELWAQLTMKIIGYEDWNDDLIRSYYSDLRECDEVVLSKYDINGFSNGFADNLPEYFTDNNVDFIASSECNLNSELDTHGDTMSGKHAIRLHSRPTMVFTSEDYGSVYAEYLQCEHILVDKARLQVPVSGTKVRGNACDMWEYISKPLREYYAYRFICMSGDVITRSALVTKLATHYNTNYSTTQNTPDNTETDLSTVAITSALQLNLQENIHARECNHLLFCDDDSFTLYLSIQQCEVLDVFQQLKECMDMNRRHYLVLPNVDSVSVIVFNQLLLCHVLTGHVLYSDTQAPAMHELITQELQTQNLNYIVLNGFSVSELQHSAIEYIDRVLYGVKP